MSATNLALDEIAQFQLEADQCAELFKSYQSERVFRVLAVTGTPYPWRLIEEHRERGEVASRQMHCFESPVNLCLWLQEHRHWKRYDRALSAARLVHARRALGSSDASSSLEQALHLYEALTRDLEAIAGERQRVKELMCLTQPDRTLMLPVGLSRWPR